MLHHRIIGSGTPIVILHGVGLDHRIMMDAMEPAFRVSGSWKRIYVDLPGHGQSPARIDIRSQDDVLNVVIQFIHQMMPNETFGVVGLSRGSYIARGIVYRMPERLCGAALIVPGGNPSSDPDRLPAVQILKPDPSIRPDLAESEVWSHENMSVVQRWDIVEKRRSLVAPARALFDAAQDKRVMENFEFSFAQQEAQAIFDKPSLIVAGRQDSISGYRDSVDLMEQFSRATLAVLDTAGHALSFERPEILHALMRDWLDRL